MELLQINGGKTLSGVTNVHGAKNSVLPILAGCVLVNGVSVIHNCPKLSDVDVTINILKYLGAKVKREDDTLVVDTSVITKNDIPKLMMQELRSSIIFLGSLVSRTDCASLYLPGGCEIGLRPVDLHLKGLSQLGYNVSFDGCTIYCKKENVKSCEIVLPFPSVGATENIILASVFIKGKTTIINAAKEPEIVDLVNFLNSAGAKIRGASSPVIEIEGVDSLHSTEHTVIPDRILATTMMCAAAITSSELRVNKIDVSQLKPVYPIFYEMGCDMFLDYNALTIKSPKRLKRVKSIKTLPYPGFPTDCQSPITAVLSTAKGTSVVNETIFEDRFKFISQLNRFGTDIIVDGKTAVITGVKKLHPADVCCTDLRGGAAVILASLAADGVSIISNLSHIDRGYECIENQLSLIGADIKRIYNEEKRTEKRSKT